MESVEEDEEVEEYIASKVRKFILEKDLIEVNENPAVDSIWFVFNTDDCDMESLTKIRNEIDNLFKSQYGISNPNFSIWISFHKNKELLHPVFVIGNKERLKRIISASKQAFSVQKDYSNNEEHPTQNTCTIHCLIEDLIQFTDNLGIWK